MQLWTLVYLYIGLLWVIAITIGANTGLPNEIGDAKVRRYGPTRMALAYMIGFVGFWPVMLVGMIHSAMRSR